MANAPVSATNKAVAGNANATTPATTSPPPTAGTVPTKPNYGAQTGGGAKVTYKQPTTSVPSVPPKSTSPNMMQPPATAPATVASTAPGQKIKPGQPGYDQLAKATLKELQAPVSPALAAFRDRTDGKYEAYLKAFVQKNLLSGLGFRGLVNQQEIDNAIKAIALPANAAPAKQRPLWTDLARATALALPATGALTGRDPKAPTASQEAPVGYKINDGKGGTITKTDKGWFRSADNYLIPTNSLAHKDYEGLAASGSTGIPNASGATTPGEEPAATAEPTKPVMTRDQISQWISRNSEDHATLKAALDAINAVKV
jgi:hypothetical protein